MGDYIMGVSTSDLWGMYNELLQNGFEPDTILMSAEAYHDIVKAREENNRLPLTYPEVNLWEII